MTTITFTEHEQQLIDELRMCDPACVRLFEGNQTMPHMLKEFLARIDDFYVGWMNEEDPESPFEAVFYLKDNATAADGILVCSYASSLFTAFDLQLYDDQHDGRTCFRLMFDNADELDEGDRVKTYEGRVGTVNAVERENQDEPRSLRVNVTFDDNSLGEWVPRVEIERVDGDEASSD